MYQPKNNPDKQRSPVGLEKNRSSQNGGDKSAALRASP
jgi:hypothetical protein